MEGSMHCIESVCIRNCSVPHFPALGLNTERYIRIWTLFSQWVSVGKLDRGYSLINEVYRWYHEGRHITFHQNLFWCGIPYVECHSAQTMKLKFGFSKSDKRTVCNLQTRPGVTSLSWRNQWPNLFIKWCPQCKFQLHHIMSGNS